MYYIFSLDNDNNNNNNNNNNYKVEVEDVTGRQFEAAAETEDILAVYWCK